MVGALKPFAQLKVVELAGSIGGAYCGVGAATNASRQHYWDKTPKRCLWTLQACRAPN